MDNKTFNIYCDESTHLEHDGQPYMVYGYVSIAYNQMKGIKDDLKRIKLSHNHTSELKWTDVSDLTFPLYKDLIDYFFRTEMNFRAVIVDKSQIDNTRPEYSFNDFYFRMYFQLLHHKIDMESTYNIYFDIKDTCSQKKLHQLKDYLKWNASIRNFQFIKSHESTFLQMADVIMGAINYHLRVERGTIEGKSIAKRKIVQLIQNHTNLSLVRPTSKSAQKFNLFFISLKH
jgi:hypothetical protein